MNSNAQQVTAICERNNRYVKLKAFLNKKTGEVNIENKEEQKELGSCVVVLQDGTLLSAEKYDDYYVVNVSFTDEDGYYFIPRLRNYEVDYHAIRERLLEIKSFLTTVTVLLNKETFISVDENGKEVVKLKSGYFEGYDPCGNYHKGKEDMLTRVCEEYWTTFYKVAKETGLWIEKGDNPYNPNRPALIVCAYLEEL